MRQPALALRVQRRCAGLAAMLVLCVAVTAQETPESDVDLKSDVLEWVDQLDSSSLAIPLQVLASGIAECPGEG